MPPLANWPFVPNQLQIFDFSERKQSTAAAAAMSPSVFGGGADGAVVVTRVGDALQEPFWPEGLGINLEASYTRLTAPTWPRASPTSRAHGVAVVAWTWPQPRR